MKKWLWAIMFAFCVGGMLTGCGREDRPRIEVSSDRITMKMELFSLAFHKADAGWGFSLLEGENQIGLNEVPVAVRIFIGFGKSAVVTRAPYASVEKKKDTVVCQGIVTTEQGASFQIVDTYSVSDGKFLMDRTVTVVEDAGDEMGFASIFSLFDDKKDGTAEDYDYFIPSLLYKNNECLSADAIFHNIGPINYAKETRCGTPLVMIRGKEDGYSLALVHVHPAISTSEKCFGQAVAFSDEQQYGSLGFVFDRERENQASIDFVYPSTETPRSYEGGSGSIQRYHKITVGNSHSYTLALLATKKDSYNDAMVQTYLDALSLEEPVIAKVDQQRVYDLNMEIYDELFLHYDGTEGRYSAGYPFAANILNLEDFYSVSFQIGFIGAQTAIASELIRDGVRNGHASALEKGKEILDFWSSDDVYTEALPPSWWSPQENETAGGSTGYPSFLRCMTDGAEGLLAACLYAKEAEGSIDYGPWEAAAVKIADFLVDHQNEDGSYYRAYFANGEVCTDTSSPAYQGISKLNTPVPIRFLCSMYDYTGDRRYYDAAVRAADYSYEELYLDLGQYVGGTPDNPNVPDKEAAIFALYGFSAVYDMTGDEKYYPALEHAAVSAMSWVYTYDFAVPFALQNNYTCLDYSFDGLNLFKEGGTAGWSIITTRASAIDVFGSNACFELFKQYLRSGNTAYQKVAGLLQNNCKTAMDLDGSRGYLYGGFSMEASNVADQIFYTVENGVWLPWISAAFMEPMMRMDDTFGSFDLYELCDKYSIKELRERMEQ